MKRLFFCAGEASGDLHAGAVLEKLPGFAKAGIGGDRMIAAGLDPLFHIRETSVMGFTEVAANYFRLKAIFRRTCGSLRDNRPDLVVLVDYPGFNIRLASEARRLNIPVLYYITPKVWAWGRGRVVKMARCVDRAAVIFPFEEKIFRDAGIRTDFVGNPVAHVVYGGEDRLAFLERLGLPTGARLLGMLPGSRGQEVARMLPAMARAGRELVRQGRFDAALVSHAPSIGEQGLYAEIRGDPVFRLVDGSAGPIFAHSDFLFVKSGTATLEAALHGTPFVSLYRTSLLSALIGRMLVSVPSFTMVNIVCGKKVVPELFQWEATAGNLVRESLSILDDPEKQASMRGEFGRMKADLISHSPPESVANIIREMVDG